MISSLLILCTSSHLQLMLKVRVVFFELIPWKKLIWKNTTYSETVSRKMIPYI